MNNDDYEDFISWKRGIAHKYADLHLAKKEFEDWKRKSEISGYDERVLMRVYTLEKRIDELEEVVYKLTEV